MSFEVVVLLAAELHSLHTTARPIQKKKQGDIANEDQDEGQGWRRCLGHLAELSRVLRPLSPGIRRSEGKKKSG